MTIDKIICVGKNYLEHALELGDAVPENPVLFLKPASVLKQAENWGETIKAKFPEGEKEIHPECEIVLKIGKNQRIEAVSLGLDMTLRTRQAQLKKLGHPWTTAKVFLDAAIVGPWLPMKDMMDLEFTLSIDGVLRQRGYASEMRMQSNNLLDYISQFFPICEGDLIFTGTPAGVSPIVLGTTVRLQWGEYFYDVKWE